jgi:hypothetical protein
MIIKRIIKNVVHLQYSFCDYKSDSLKNGSSFLLGATNNDVCHPHSLK